MTVENVEQDRPGSTVENVYVKRTVTVLAVHEHEVQDISFMNTLATTAFSISSVFIGFGGGILTNAAFADTITPTARAALRMGVPLCLIAAFIAAWLGWIAITRRKSTLAQIKEQSESVG